MNDAKNKITSPAFNLSSLKWFLKGLNFFIGRGDL